MFSYEDYVKMYVKIFSENVDEKDRLYSAVVFHEILNRVMGNTILEIGDHF